MIAHGARTSAKTGADLFEGDYEAAKAELQTLERETNIQRAAKSGEAAR